MMDKSKEKNSSFSVVFITTFIVFIFAFFNDHATTASTNVDMHQIIDAILLDTIDKFRGGSELEPDFYVKLKLWIMR